jgi:hypothetical protein
MAWVAEQFTDTGEFNELPEVHDCDPVADIANDR